MAWLYVVWGDDHADIGFYHRYALAMFDEGASRRLPAEYPILALVPFSLTLIPAGDYGVAFVVSMAVIVLASITVVWRTGPYRVAAAFTTYLLLGGPWTLFGRYDLVVSMVVLGAVLAASTRKWRVAYALLAAGVLLKLYPLFLFPLFVIAQSREGPRNRAAIVGPAIFALVAGAGLLASALLDANGWLNPVSFALRRPTEAESLPSTMLWILAGFGSPGGLQHSFNSANVVSAESSLVNVVFLIASVTGLAAVYALHANGRLSLRRGCLAALLVVVVTSRVLSPQYLLWLLPLAAFEFGLTPLWVAICVLTFLVYPVLFELTGLSDRFTATSYAFPFLLAVAARNLLLVLVTWRTLTTPPLSSSRGLDRRPGAGRDDRARAAAAQ